MFTAHTHTYTHTFIHTLTHIHTHAVFVSVTVLGLNFVSP